MRDGFLLLVGGEEGVLIDCCRERKEALEREYGAVVLKEVINSTVPLPHCGLGCLHEHQ